MIESGAVMLRVDDLETASRFYVDMLGFRPAPPRTGLGVELALSGLTLLLVQRPQDQRRPASDPYGWMGLALTVVGIEAEKRSLESRGVRFEGDIVDLPVGRVAFFQDPDGYTLGLIERA